jgi:hypothetical protein
MNPKCLINFSVLPAKKVEYTAACASLGVSISQVCRLALDNSVLLSQKVGEHAGTDRTPLSPPKLILESPSVPTSLKTPKTFHKPPHRVLVYTKPSSEAVP